MTQAGPTAAPRVKLSHRLEVTALWALLRLTVRQQIRGRKGYVLVALYLFFCGLALLLRSLQRPVPADELEFGFVFNLVPHALAPLTALLYASGMIQDEVEEQTLTYLLVRPLPRWALYLTKWLGTLLVSIVLTAGMTGLLLIATHWNDSIDRDVLLTRAGKAGCLLALTQVAYCSIFAGLSLLFRRALVLGVAYIVVLEGFVASIDFIVRRLTVMYYFRVLCLRWLDLPEAAAAKWKKSWAINLDEVPDMATCVQVLVLVSLVVTLLAAVRFSVQEFRLKTPESS